MNFRPEIYLLNTFQIPKNKGVNEWVGWRRIQETTKKWHKINEISTLSLLNNSLQNATKVGMFLLSFKTI